MAREPKSMQVTPDAARLLFERSDNFVCTVDLEGRFTSVNPAGEAISGYTARELLGKPALALIAPDARDDAVEQFQERLAADGPDAAESILLRRDGSRVPISISSTLIQTDGHPTGVLAIIHDLSERHRASDALLESEQRFRGSFESAALGMALVAPDGRFLEVNQALCDLVGYDAASLSSLHVPGDHAPRRPGARSGLHAADARRRDPHVSDGEALLPRHAGASCGSFSASRSSAAPTASLATSSPRSRTSTSASARPTSLLTAARSLQEAQQLAKIGSWEYRSGARHGLALRRAAPDLRPRPRTRG